MPRKLACSFCGKPEEQVRRLIAGPRVFICDACVTLCNDILAQHPPGESTIVTPRRALRRWWQGLLKWRSVAH